MSLSKDKAKLLLIGVVLALVAAMAGLYFFSVVSHGITYSDAASILLPLAIIVGFGAFVFKRHKEVEKGGVLEDERSRNIMNISLARAYLLSLYWLLALGFFSADLGLDSLAASTITGLGILGMAILLGVSYVYTSRFDASIMG